MQHIKLRKLANGMKPLRQVTLMTIKKTVRQSAVVLMVCLMTACSASKLIPEGDYMLDRVVMESDQRGFDVAVLEPYIRQQANSKWFAAFKIPLGTYAMAGNDTTKWINRTLRRIGEKPVLFDTLQARLSCEDLTRAMHNMGYMEGTVSLQTFTKGRKLLALYTLHPGHPYYLRTMSYDIQDNTVAEVLKKHLNPVTGSSQKLFNVQQLDAERKRLTKILSDSGYYRFHKEYIDFTADSLGLRNEVDVTLHLHPYSGNGDTLETTHPRYRIRDVLFTSTDSTQLHLRRKVLENTSAIEPGDYFSATNLQRTYRNFGRLGAIRYTNIRFDEIEDSNLLDCRIQLLHQKPNTISFQPEGTNTAGNLGAAASLTYLNRNLFRGSELLSVELRAAFEAITGLEGYENHDYREYGVVTKLQFPRFVAPLLSRRFVRRSTATSELSITWNSQDRPEFHRRLFSTAWRYRWNSPRRHTNYNFDLLDLSYIYMPWISSTFKRDYIDGATNRNAILRYNYEDLFIMKVGFGMSFNDGNSAYRFSVESSGNLMQGLSSVFHFRENGQGQHTLLNIAYAQYAKGDFSYTRLFRINDNNQLALHGAFGIAYPYGNSKVLPFEKRYFSGGANSVRGWSVRELGPGKFKGTDGRIDFINQTGDLKLDFNAEIRSQLFWKFSGAAFIDAGNIWTLRAYEEQTGGQFHFDEFYKQIAAAYGLGLRLNFDYFIMRFDMGMKAINPAYETSREHYPVIHPKFGRDFTFHFAVGLPF